MKEKIRRATEMAWKKYGVKIKITFNPQGFDLGIDEPIYYKAQSQMVQDIQDIIGLSYKNTDIYVL